MSIKNLLSKLSLSLVLLLVSAQVYAESPAYSFRLNQLFVNPSSASGPTTIRSPELYAKATVAASQTDSAIVAAVAGKKIRVLQIAFIPAGTATTSTFNTKPAGAGVAITGAFSPAASTPVVLPFSPAGWFETASGEGLSVTTGAGATTVYQVTYVAY